MVLTLSTIGLSGTAQSLASAQSSTQPARVNDYWVDPSTGLMWTAKDNGKDVSYRGAIKYCQKLRLAGYSDWRLANMWNLQRICDKSANVPGSAGKGENFTWHVKGSLFLTGDQWSRTIADRKETWGYAYYFDFNEGKSNDQPFGPLYSFTGMRALCVRGGSD